MGTVETIMEGSNHTILNQIAKFFLFLSEVPSYCLTLNTSCDHSFHLSMRLGMDESNYNAQGDLLLLKFESQLQMDRLPPPESICSGFNNKNFVRTQRLLLCICILTCFWAARTTAFMRVYHQNHWHHGWAYLI